MGNLVRENQKSTIFVKNPIFGLCVHLFILGRNPRPRNTQFHGVLPVDYKMITLTFSIKIPTNVRKSAFSAKTEKKSMYAKAIFCGFYENHEKWYFNLSICHK